MVSVVPVDTTGRVFRIKDVADRLILELSQSTDTKDVVIALAPAWKVDVPAEELVTTVLRQRNLMQTYALAMTLIVIVLVVCTSFLLAFGHVLRKTRDIGVLLTNGACRSAIFAIYLGQIAAMVVAGCLLGVAFAFGAESLVEGFARGMMQRLLAELPEQGDAAVADVLDLNLRVLGTAVTSITVSALGGAVLPVFLATRFDPLSEPRQGRLGRMTSARPRMRALRPRLSTVFVVASTLVFGTACAGAESTRLEPALVLVEVGVERDVQGLALSFYRQTDSAVCEPDQRG